MSLVNSRVVPILFAFLSLSASSIKSTELVKTLEELNPGPADSETARFLLPRLAEKYSKYAPSRQDFRGRLSGDVGTEDVDWDDYVFDPKLFLLTETEEAPPNEDNNGIDYRDKREALVSNEAMGNSFRSNWKNSGPSLSIVNPLDVLRQRLLLEIARRRQEKSQSQINENRKILTSLGKRSGQYQDRLRDVKFEPRHSEIVARFLEPRPSYSKWTSSLAEFPKFEHPTREHRNYNRRVN